MEIYMEKNNKGTITNRTEEIQDIIERMPRNTGRAIVWFIVGLSVTMLFFGWLIKYPAVAKGPITITAKLSPVKLVSKTSGKINLLNHKSNDFVKEGEIVALIETSADLQDILTIDFILKNLDLEAKITKDVLYRFPRNLNLGEMTEIYFRFLNALELTVRFPSNQNFRFQKEEYRLDIRSQNDIISQLDSLRLIKEKTKKVVINLMLKDSIQYYQIKGISETEFDKTKLDYYNSLENSLFIQKDLLSSRNQVKVLKNKFNQLTLDQQSYEQKIGIDLISSCGELKYLIRQWLMNYTFKAPITGKLEFLDFWKQNDFVESGKELFSVIPEQNNIEGNVYLPISGAGKVVVGQHVNIKLDNFPSNEFGVINGKVKSVSLLARKKISLSENQVTYAYLVVVELPNNLTTNYGSNLGFQYEINGVAEIITDKRRLIERLFDNLKYIAKIK